MSLARPGYYAISLVNDLYSWRKERIEAQRMGQEYVFNAVWVIMRERGCAEHEAIAECEKEIRQYIAAFDGTVNEARKGRPELSKDAMRYLEAVRLSHVGNLVWSKFCPRYQGVIEESELDTDVRGGDMAP